MAVQHRIYWADTVTPFAPDPADLPESADVVVIGGGYTGLMAAAELARAGRHTVVAEAGAIGHGCSARNGGQVGPSIKASLEALSQAFGADRALAIRRVGQEAYDAFKALVDQEALDVDWRETGRIQGAHDEARFASLRHTLATQPQGAQQPYRILSRQELPAFLGGSSYVGGAFYPRAGAINPAKLLVALAARAQAAGAVLCPQTPVFGITPAAGGRHRVETARGPVTARQVLVATNGYTGAATPWLRRRLIPITSTIVATQTLTPERVATLIPDGRVVVDTRAVVVYYRPSPDGRRILFGGRVGAFDLPPDQAARRLTAMLRRIFPSLEDVEAEQVWSGTVAFSFDKLPHLGAIDGIHHCLGYCGSGIALATWGGRKVAQQMLGLAEGRTALDGLPFDGRWYYGGRPWFLGTAVAAMRLRDRVPLLERLLLRPPAASDAAGSSAPQPRRS